jgi:hypothetical protein
MVAIFSNNASVPARKRDRPVTDAAAFLTDAHYPFRARYFARRLKKPPFHALPILE